MVFLVNSIAFAFICKTRTIIFISHLNVMINSKCIRDLNVKCENTKLSGERIEENLYDLRLGKMFLVMVPEAQPIKKKIMVNWTL